MRIIHDLTTGYRVEVVVLDGKIHEAELRLNMASSASLAETKLAIREFEDWINTLKPIIAGLS